MAGVLIVTQQCGRLTHVHDENIDIAVIVDIAESSATAGMFFSYGCSAQIADIFETSIAKVAVRQAWVAILLRAIDQLGINMAVDLEDVKPSVVVQVGQRDTPANVLRVHSKAGLENDVLKNTFAKVAVDVGMVTRKVGLDEIGQAVAIEVAISNAHTALLEAVFV